MSIEVDDTVSVVKHDLVMHAIGLKFDNAREHAMLLAHLARWAHFGAELGALNPTGPQAGATLTYVEPTAHWRADRSPDRMMQRLCAASQLSYDPVTGHLRLAAPYAETTPLRADGRRMPAGRALTPLENRPAMPSAAAAPALRWMELAERHPAASRLAQRAGGLAPTRLSLNGPAPAQPGPAGSPVKAPQPT